MTTTTNSGLRQQVLVLYLGYPALDAPVVGWARYDGTAETQPMTGDSDTPPYATGVDALVDGWRLIQLAHLVPPDTREGHEHDVAFLRHEFVFERLVHTSL